MSERPVECSHCMKPVKILYKEIVDTSIVCSEMCGDCPIYQQRLHGQGLCTSPEKKAEAGLYCGTCGTDLASVKMGNPLGCSECYTVFSDLLLSELLLGAKIPSHINKRLLHLGKSPHQSLALPASSRLTTLNEALNDALKKENYEQAAWIRDQIKTLKENHDGKT